MTKNVVIDLTKGTGNGIVISTNPEYFFITYDLSELAKVGKTIGLFVSVEAKRPGRRLPHGHVAGDDADLALEVEPPGRVAVLDGVGRAEQDAGAALVDERVGRERGRRLGPLRRPL